MSWEALYELYRASLKYKELIYFNIIILGIQVIKSNETREE